MNKKEIIIIVNQEVLVKYFIRIFPQKLESKVPGRFVGRDLCVRDTYILGVSGSLTRTSEKQNGRDAGEHLR